MGLPKPNQQYSDRKARKLVIAIDGPAGAGKSTVAGLLARLLGFQLLDTGALYRVMALHLMRNGIEPGAACIPNGIVTSLDLRMEPHAGSMRFFLGSEEVTRLIREERVGTAASAFSAKPHVRKALLGLQRSAGHRWNLVAEGRDMGTIVFPDADIKFFVTADLEVRSQRRYQELLAGGKEVEARVVLAEMRARDRRDETREVSPLMKAPDAILIDTTHLGQREVVDKLLSYIRRRPALAGI